jgi:hypothetical protein
MTAQCQKNTFKTKGPTLNKQKHIKYSKTSAKYPENTSTSKNKILKTPAYQQHHPPQHINSTKLDIEITN